MLTRREGWEALPPQQTMIYKCSRPTHSLHTLQKYEEPTEVHQKPTKNAAFFAIHLRVLKILGLASSSARWRAMASDFACQTRQMQLRQWLLPKPNHYGCSLQLQLLQLLLPLPPLPPLLLLLRLPPPCCCCWLLLVACFVLVLLVVTVIQFETMRDVCCCMPWRESGTDISLWSRSPPMPKSRHPPKLAN